MEAGSNRSMVNMNEKDEIAATFTRQEWQIIFAGLGELPGKIMYDTAKKVEALLRQEIQNDHV